MAYRSRRSFRSSYRRRPRRYMRKSRGRFSKKRFNKYSTSQKTVVRPLINARETYVKLPWQDTDNLTLVSAGNSSRFAVLGNSLVGVPADYTNIAPVNPTEWAAGVNEYAQFYNKYRVLGASVKIQVVLHSGTDITAGCVLIPIAHGGAEGGVPVNAVAERLAELDALTYDELCLQPHAKSKLIGVANSGNSSVFFKMFRKTKQMISARDIRDVEECLLRLPNPGGTGGTVLLSSRSAWFFYFRLFNLSAGNLTFDHQVRVKYYANLSGRTNWVPQIVPV